MKIPERVRIGGVDYDVVVEPMVRAGTKILYGEINYGACAIKLSEKDNSNLQHMGLTLWHEILHGIAEHACLVLPDEDCETIIDVFAKGVYQVLQDNAAAFFDLKEAEVDGTQ